MMLLEVNVWWYNTYNIWKAWEVNASKRRYERNKMAKQDTYISFSLGVGLSLDI